MRNSRYIYKAKRVDNGEWICGSLITGVCYMAESGADIPYILNADKSDADCFEDYTEGLEYLRVIPETICQCTGLKDKNGKLIYENDIVFVTDEDECTDGFDTGVGQIMFLKGLWYIDGRVQNGLYDVFDEGFNIEVIGNKFDSVIIKDEGMTDSEVLKQIPRKVIDIHKAEDEEEAEVYGIDAMFGECPTCGESVSSVWNDYYCGYCGQKLDWEDKA